MSSVSYKLVHKPHDSSPCQLYASQHGWVSYRILPRYRLVYITSFVTQASFPSNLPATQGTEHDVQRQDGR